MKATDLKKGSTIATSVDGVNFVEAKITRVSDKFVWFNGSGYSRIARTTFENHKQLFKIISI